MNKLKAWFSELSTKNRTEYGALLLWLIMGEPEKTEKIA